MALVVREWEAHRHAPARTGNTKKEEGKKRKKKRKKEKKKKKKKG